VLLLLFKRLFAVIIYSTVAGQLARLDRESWRAGVGEPAQLASQESWPAGQLAG